MIHLKNSTVFLVELTFASKRCISGVIPALSSFLEFRVSISTSSFLASVSCFCSSLGDILGSLLCNLFLARPPIFRCLKEICGSSMKLSDTTVSTSLKGGITFHFKRPVAVILCESCVFLHVFALLGFMVSIFDVLSFFLFFFFFPAISCLSPAFSACVVRATALLALIHFFT